jgi:hypothetical protein
MDSRPCPLCRCPTPGGHACSTVPAEREPLPPVPLMVECDGRRAVFVAVPGADLDALAAETFARLRVRHRG